MCLARALIRKSRIVLLDEATSSVDYGTDTIIQATLREEFGRGQSTVIAIAHRLDSIASCDRVAVMSDGWVVEFDRPGALLRKTNSRFSRLIASADEKGSPTAETTREFVAQ